MADRNSTKYFESAYREAKSYSQKIMKECEDISTDYVEKDKFYEDFSPKKIALTAVYLVVGIAGFILHGYAFGYIEKYLFTRWNFGVLEGYFSLVYNLAFIGLITLGVWNLLKLIYSKKTKRELDNMTRLSDSLKAEMKNIETRFQEFMTQIFNHSAEVSIGNANQYESTLEKYRDKAESIGVKTTKAKKIFLCVLFAALVVIHFLFLGRYAVYSISLGYRYPAVVVICSSYLLLYILFYEFQISTFEYLKKATKYVTIALFAVYQILMGICMSHYKLFSAVTNIGNDIADDDPEWLGMVLTILEKYVLTKGSVFLIVTSILCLMFIIRTDAEKELHIRENGATIPMIGARDRVKSRAEVGRENKIAFIAAAAFAVIASKYMAGILTNKLSFGRVVLYIVLGMVWFFVDTLFPGKDEKMLYGKRLDWVKHSFFFSYMFLTLAMVPGFGDGSVSLILLQPVLSIVAFRFLVSLIYA